MADFGSMDGFGLYFVQGSLVPFLRKSRCRGDYERLPATITKKVNRVLLFMISMVPFVWFAVERAKSMKKGRTELVRPWKLLLWNRTRK